MLFFIWCDPMQQMDLAKLYPNILIFCKVIECGKFAIAAQKLGVSQSKVSKQITQLEYALEEKLLLRNSRTLVLTKAGENLYQHFKSLDKVFSDFAGERGGEHTSFTGKVRVSLPIALSYYVFAALLPSFVKEFPDIKLEICFQARNVDLVKDGFDFAIVHYIPRNDALKIKTLVKVSPYLYCTRKYQEKYGQINKVADLAKHNVIGILTPELSEMRQFHLSNQAGLPVTLYYEPQVTINTALYNKQLLFTHEFIVGGWDGLFAQELETGEVIKLFPHYSKSINFYIVRLANTIFNSRIEAAIKFIEGYFENADF